MLLITSKKTLSKYVFFLKENKNHLINNILRCRKAILCKKKRKIILQKIFAIKRKFISKI